jgi:hypothetical protein
MKVVKTSKSKGFTPLELSITIERPRDLLKLMHLFNLSDDETQRIIDESYDSCKSIQLSPEYSESDLQGVHGLTDGLWNIIYNHALEEKMIVKTSNG